MGIMWRVVQAWRAPMFRRACTRMAALRARRGCCCRRLRGAAAAGCRRLPARTAAALGSARRMVALLQAPSRRAVVQKAIADIVSRLYHAWAATRAAGGLDGRCSRHRCDRDALQAPLHSRRERSGGERARWRRCGGLDCNRRWINEAIPTVSILPSTSSSLHDHLQATPQPQSSNPGAPNPSSSRPGLHAPCRYPGRVPALGA